MTAVIDSTAARTPRTLCLVAGLLLAVAVAGCGGSGGAPRGEASSGTPGLPSSGTPGPTPSGAPSPDATPEAGFPAAANGTNVRSCYDGSCEILVTKRVTIPLDPRFGFKTFSFDPADSTWRYTYPEGGSGSLKFLEPPYSGEWAGPSAKQGLAMRVVATEGSRAVISLRPQS
ncbi:hypothetical protein [Plantactinospora sp. CA-290183]|uniref:hypothetical protein n=1 Tax=Plantactinospora sp. CA-290183 TaxID=3240006 RepID=UPI003D945D14